MSRIFPLSADSIVGGSVSSDRILVPAKVISHCEGCGNEQQFPVPTRLNSGNGSRAHGFSSKCWKCEHLNKFFLSYPTILPESGHIYPSGIYHFAENRVEITDENVRLIEEKASKRLDEGDYDGAIALCYTGVEKYLKALLIWRGIEFGNSEGDIRKLFKLLAKDLEVSPREEMHETEKRLGSSCIALVEAIYAVSNKGSDRHDAEFLPRRDAAQMTLNITFSFCVYLEALTKHP